MNRKSMEEIKSLEINRKWMEEIKFLRMNRKAMEEIKRLGMNRKSMEEIFLKVVNEQKIQGRNKNRTSEIFQSDNSDKNHAGGENKRKVGKR